MSTNKAALTWVIHSRIKSQKFLLNFANWMNSNQCKKKLDDSKAKHFRLATGMLQGSVFALWRACFLIDNTDVVPTDSTLTELGWLYEMN